MEFLKRWRVAGYLLLAGAGGCDFQRDPVSVDVAGSVGVFSVLRAGSDTVSVLILGFPDNPEPFVRSYTPIAGAEVHLGVGNTSVRLEEAPAGFARCAQSDGAPADMTGGCYVAVIPGGVRPDGRYTLAIRLPGGGTVRGETVVPQPPVLISPGPGARVRAAADGPGYLLDLVWETPAGVGAVDVSIRTDLASCSIFYEEQLSTSGSFRLGGARPGRDSTVLRIAGVGCSERGVPVRVDSIGARVRITAYDTAYARYADEAVQRNAVLVERASAGLQGAIGVFGAAASTERGVIFARTD